MLASCPSQHLHKLLYMASTAKLVAEWHNIPLIVDEAHGSHFAFDPAFPEVAFFNCCLARMK